LAVVKVGLKTFHPSLIIQHTGIIICVYVTVKPRNLSGKNNVLGNKWCRPAELKEKRLQRYVMLVI